MLSSVALSLLLSAAPADASTVALSGRVVDPSGGAVVRARVSAAADAGPAVTTETDGRGEFTVAVAPGAYTVKVAAPGFQEAVRPVTVAGGHPAALAFTLAVEKFGETVDVEASGDYRTPVISTAMKTATPLRDTPQSVTVVTRELIKDQLMTSVGDVVRYTPGMATHQGENNRDQVIIRGNSSSADFFLNGVRDDVQYYRDLYNLERVEAIKGPNAMIFGRGGGGGLVNRVTKEAEFHEVRDVTVQGGGFDHRRFAADLDHPLGETVALRLNGMYEDSGSFRDRVTLERYGVNPTLTWAPRESTRLTLGYEHLHDTRVADRGITSFHGLPAEVPFATFYGDPDQSHVRAGVDLASAAVEHHRGALTLRNRTLFGDYDRFYQNFVPGAVSADGARVTLTAYNNATRRQNVFNQSDLVVTGATGSVRHTLLAGVEVGRQLTDNFRNTGFFNNTATSVTAPFDAPTISTPVTFRQGATDADNHLRTNVAAAYVQDQVELNPKLQLVGGLRLDRFDLEYHNNRNGDTLGRVDNLASPRAGLVFKPLLPVSVYGTYTVSYLPSSGDQFSSLTVITEQVEPEKFTNYEAGIKWDVRPALALTAAAYRLDRTNTRATDPNDPTRIVQTGSQRTKGFELGLTGRVTRAWRVAGGYTYQDAFVTSATTAAKAGAQVGQVPHHTLSLWNNYQFVPRLAAAVGVLHRSDMFATIDNSVTLRAYTRVDVAAFFTLNKALRLQANLENALDEQYFINADSNTNISPGFGRTLRVALTGAF